AGQVARVRADEEGGEEAVPGLHRTPEPDRLVVHVGHRELCVVPAGRIGGNGGDQLAQFGAVGGGADRLPGPGQGGGKDGGGVGGSLAVHDHGMAGVVDAGGVQLDGGGGRVRVELQELGGSLRRAGGAGRETAGGLGQLRAGLRTGGGERTGYGGR